MPANLKYKATLKNARLDELTAAVGASGLLRIYSGTQPATPDAALSGNTLLAELACSATWAPAASGGTLTVNAITSDISADNTGTAAWSTFTTSGGTRQIDFSAGTSASDLILNTVSIVSGATVSVTSAVFTAGN